MSCKFSSFSKYEFYTWLYKIGGWEGQTSLFLLRTMTKMRAKTK
jgi:hypothetical protein